MWSTSLRALLVFLGLSCGLYPLAVTGLGQLLFPVEANGSLVRDDSGQVIGSSLVGQAWMRPAYLQGRPSVSGYDGLASGGSNLSPTSPVLSARRAAEEARLRAENPDATGPIPEPLLAASASGLDPDLPVSAARWQIPRIAHARKVDSSRIERLLDAHIVGRDLGLLGEARVSVLTFNLALDRHFGAPHVATSP